jgi:tetratricopeptide (TPR) repeat protein
MQRTVSYLLLAVACSCAAIAQTAQDEFERGNTFYREGRYDQAAGTYEAILKQGLASSSLYFNIGNCYYRMGKIAPAILAYERALRLQPNDVDIKHNLDLVNLKTLDRIEPLPEIFFIDWLRSFSAVVPLHTTTRLFAACWLLLFAGLSMLYLLTNPAVLRFLRGLSITSALALIPLVIVLVTQVVDSGNRTDAIVTTSVVTAKTSPDAQSLDAFVAHEGLKVKLSDAVGEWMKIVLPDGKVGWIRSEDCERI